MLSAAEAYGHGRAIGGERPIVAITRRDLPGEPAARLSAIANVRAWQGAEPPNVDEITSLAADASALLCLASDPLGAPLLTRLPRLRLLALASMGYDSVDLATAARQNIIVTNTPGVLNETVADTTFGLILGARRRLVEADRFVRAGKWQENPLSLLVGLDVYGARLGLVGYGGIGRAVARRALGFGMDVICYHPVRHDDEAVRSVPFDVLLQTSDIVSVHVPLSASTRGMFGEREFRLMKSTATFVNTSRGGVVDEPALIRALSEGWIGSAGLDVQALEPNPDPNDELLKFENCVVLPHIGSASEAARVAMVRRAVENIEAVLAGQPPLTPVRAG